MAITEKPSFMLTVIAGDVETRNISLHDSYILILLANLHVLLYLHYWSAKSGIEL